MQDDSNVKYLVRGSRSQGPGGRILRSCDVAILRSGDWAKWRSCDLAIGRSGERARWGRWRRRRRPPVRTIPSLHDPQFARQKNLAILRCGDLAMWRLGEVANERGGVAGAAAGDPQIARSSVRKIPSLHDPQFARSPVRKAEESCDLAMWRSCDLAIGRSGDLAIWRLGEVANERGGVAGTAAVDPQFARSSVRKIPSLHDPQFARSPVRKAEESCDLAMWRSCDLAIGRSGERARWGRWRRRRRPPDRTIPSSQDPQFARSPVCTIPSSQGRRILRSCDVAILRCGDWAKWRLGEVANERGGVAGAAAGDPQIARFSVRKILSLHDPQFARPPVRKAEESCDLAMWRSCDVAIGRSGDWAKWRTSEVGSLAPPPETPSSQDPQFARSPVCTILSSHDPQFARQKNLAILRCGDLAKWRSCDG